MLDIDKSQTRPGLPVMSAAGCTGPASHLSGRRLSEVP